MLEQEKGYIEFFSYVRELLAMLKPGTQQDLLNSYLEKLWESRRKKQDIMRWNEAQPYRLLQRKCLIAMHGNVSELYGAGKGSVKLSYVEGELERRGLKADVSAIEAAVREMNLLQNWELALKPEDEENGGDE